MTSEPPDGRRIAAFFDLDKTVLATSSTLAFARPFRAEGLIDARSAIKSAYAQAMFRLGGADEKQMQRMRDHLTGLVAGWEVAQIRQIVDETLHEIVPPLVFAEAADLIADHRRRGHDVVIVSASGAEVVAPIARLLGADHAAATTMRIEDGRYTAEIENYCFGPGKVVEMERLAATHGYDLAGSYAYSDSSTDLPMLEAVGLPTAVNPDRALRKAAEERDWPILEFTDPLLPRRPERTVSLAAALALGVGVATGIGAGAAYRVRRR